MTTSAEKPETCARDKKLAVIASSFGQYSWNHLVPSPLASATASIGCEETVDRIIGSPSSAATRATASSPSGCMMPCTPTGAVSTGAGIFVPSTVAVRSRSVAPVSIRGTIRQSSNASRLARYVAPDPAAPAAYQNGSGASTPRACSSSTDRSVVNGGRAPPIPLR